MSRLTANDADIRHAYRLFLGREADPGGLATFKRWIKQHSFGPAELGAFFLASDEFKALQDLGVREIQLKTHRMYVRGNDKAVGQVIAQAGTYEPHVTAVLMSLLKPGHTFLDVGANIGYFTAMAAQAVGPAGRVIAVEPIDRNLQVVYATVQRNHLKQVVIHPFAAYDANGLAAMSVDPRSSNAGLVSDASQIRFPLYAQTRLLDDLLADEAKVDVAKFDIEGYELHAWRGYAAGLARHRPIVVTEFHPACMREGGIDPAEYFAALREYSDNISVIHRHRDLQPCADYEQLCAIWSAENQRLRMDGGAHLDLLLYPRSDRS